MVRTKQIKAKDGKMAKAGVIMEIIMDSWNVTINYSTKRVICQCCYTFQEGVREISRFVEIC